MSHEEGQSTASSELSAMSGIASWDGADNEPCSVSLFSTSKLSESPLESHSRTTGGGKQDVQQRSSMNKENEATQMCNRLDTGRLDKATDKALIHGNDKVTYVEKTSDTHTEPSIGSHHTDSGISSSVNEVKEVTNVALCEPEPVSDLEADNVTSGAPNENIVRHTFSFSLTSPRREEESHGETESGSQATASGHMSELPLPTGDSVAGIPKTKVKKPHGIRESSRDGRDSDSSVSSRKKGSSKKTKIKSKFAPGSLEYYDERLCGRVFSGWVEERRWVEAVAGYRDVIEVDEWEVEMIQQLKAIVTSVPGVQDGTRWINITPPSNSLNYCLWVLLPAPPRPGHYWFTITGVHVQPQFGLRIAIKEIREIHPHDGETAEARHKRQKKREGNQTSGELEHLGEQVQEWLNQLRDLKWASFGAAIASTFTIANIKEAVRFVVVLLMTLVLGLVTLVKESHYVALRFIREGGIFLHNITPFLQSLLSFIEKIVGGLYLLVAMVYRDLKRPSRPSHPPPTPYTPALPHTPATGPSATPYGPRQIKYVAPERWVFKTENKEPPPS